MFLHTALLTGMFSIIILIVIPSVPKAVSCFLNTLTPFFTTLIVIVKQLSSQLIVIYFKCLASNIASKCVGFRDTHIYFTPFLITFR